MDMTRRNMIASTGGALLAAGALALPAQADEGDKAGDMLYGHGMVWNRDLPGVAGTLRLAFDLQTHLDTGVGFGTAKDPTHPEWNIHFEINSVKQEKRPKGEDRFTLIGVVTEANNPDNVGLPVKILAETVGDTTAVAIELGEMTFAGAGFIISTEILFISIILILGIIVGIKR
jgi:hypothetical protein